MAFNDFRLKAADAGANWLHAIKDIAGWLGLKHREQSLRAHLETPAPILSAGNAWPYFDAEWYLQLYSDIAAAGVDPYEHYMRNGWIEGREASPYFNAGFYRDTYLNGDIHINALEHYANEGWKKGFSPNAYFSTNWYLDRYSDVAQAGVEPLQHYATFGWREERNPSPYFDVAFYLRGNPDVRYAGVEPLRHYILHGFREELRNPNEFFDGAWYFQNYGEEILPDEDPLLHYISKGADKGYAPGPRFNPAYYLANNTDVEELGEPLAHFLEHGRFEERSPHPDFVKPEESAAKEWAKLNIFSGRRREILSLALNTPLKKPSVEDSVTSSFWKSLDGIQCISFDIFDTLVERRSGRPETVFALLAQDAEKQGFRGNFVDVRKQAEIRARSIAGVREVTITEIYDQVSRISGLSLEACVSLAHTESELETKFCNAKPVGMIIYEAARALGLRVYLLSDIYLSKETVEGILGKAGIRGYDQLFVSSELGASKHYGGMFKLLIRTTKLKPEQILHIGDNEYSDGTIPRKMGIRTLQMRRSDVMTRSRILAQWFHLDTQNVPGLWSAVVSGELIHRESLVYGVQSDDAGALARVIGAQTLGPPLFAFVQFLARRAKLLGYTRLSFASRDGFYLKEAYDALCAYDANLPPSRYFLASRKVCRAAAIQSFEDIVSVAEIDHFPMSIRAFLQARFLLKDVDLAAIPASEQAELDRTVTSSRTDPVLLRVLEICTPIILKRCQDNGNAYMAYLDEIGIADPRNAIVDIGYRGTIQRNVAKLTRKRVDGLYFVTWPEISDLLSLGLRYDAFIASDRDAGDPLVRYVQLLELFFSGTHGSLSHFEMVDGRPHGVLAKTDAAPRTRQVLNAMRSGAISFVRDMAELYPRLAAAPALNGQASLGPLVEFLRNPTADVVAGLCDHKFEDAFGGESRSLVVPPDAALSLQEALADSCWREGTVSLWRAQRAGRKPTSWAGEGEAVDHFNGGETVPGYTRNPAV